ncbi:hypothetical protein JI435_160050, partial [Parastagonospora nodorum SN15]
NLSTFSTLPNQQTARWVLCGTRDSVVAMPAAVLLLTGTVSDGLLSACPADASAASARA